MLLMWIVPLIMIMLVIFAFSANKLSLALRPATSHVCAYCGQPVEDGWKNCAHCGQEL
jgi:hypothetical protein